MEYYQIPDFTSGVDVLNHPLRGDLSTCLKTQNLIPLFKGILRKRDGYYFVRDFKNDLTTIEKILYFKYCPDLSLWILIIKYPQGQGNDRVFMLYNDTWYGSNWNDLGQVDGSYYIERFLNKFYFIDGVSQIRVLGIKLDDPLNKPSLRQVKGTLLEGDYSYQYCGVNGDNNRTIASPSASITIKKVPAPVITNALPLPYSQARVYGFCSEGMYKYKITSIIENDGESLPSQEYSYDVSMLQPPTFTLTEVANGGSIPAGTYTYRLTGIKRVENYLDFAETHLYEQQIILSVNTSGVKIDITSNPSQSEIDYIRVYCNDNLIKVLSNNATTWTDTYNNRETQDIAPPSQNSTTGIKIVWQKPSNLVKQYKIYKYVNGAYKLLTTIDNPDILFYYDEGFATGDALAPTTDTTTGVRIDFEGIIGADTYKIYRNSYLIAQTSNFNYNDENSSQQSEQPPSNNTTIPFNVLLKDTSDNSNVPQGKYLKFFKDRLWVADDYNLYFSKNLIFNQFEADALVNLPLDEKITGIEVVTRNVLTQDIANFLFVGRENSGYIVSFSTQLDYIAKIFSEVEVLGQSTITNVPYGIVFISKDNVYLLDTNLNIISIGDLISPILNGTYFERARNMQTYYLKRNHLTYFNGFLRLSYYDINDTRQEFWADLRQKGSQGWYGEQVLDFNCYDVVENKLYGSKDSKIYIFSEPSELNFKDDTEDIEVQLWTKYYSCGNEYIDKLFKRYGFQISSMESTQLQVLYLIDQGKVWSENPLDLSIPATIPKYDNALFDIDRFYLGENIWTMVKAYFGTNARGKFVGFRLTEKSSSVILLNNGLIAYLLTGRIL